MAIQDRYLTLIARIHPFLTTPGLVTKLKQAHNVVVSRNALRNSLHEANLHSKPIRCPPLAGGNSGARMEWYESSYNWIENN